MLFLCHSVFLFFVVKCDATMDFTKIVKHPVPKRTAQALVCRICEFTQWAVSTGTIYSTPKRADNCFKAHLAVLYLWI